MTWLALARLIAVTLVGASCSGDPSPALLNAEVLPLPPARYWPIAWISDGLVAGVSPLGSSQVSVLEWLRPGQGNPPSPYPCPRSQVQALQQQGPVTFGAFLCNDPGRPTLRATLHLASSPLGSDEWRDFADPVANAAAATASWRADGQLAVTESGGGLSGGLILVSAAERTYPDFGLGLAQGPSWSPTQHELAFVGRSSPSLGPISAGARSSVYLWRPPTTVPRALRAGIGLSTPSWSPGGTCLVYTDEVGREKRRLNIIDLNGRSLAERAGPFGEVAWSPKGDAIAATTSSGLSFGFDDGVSLVDVPTAIRRLCGVRDQTP